MGYLPEDVDQEDAYGDLFRAGMTYTNGRSRICSRSWPQYSRLT